ncbi:hypothetical protein ACP4OV_009206 [Aristida adscensionis]
MESSSLACTGAAAPPTVAVRTAPPRPHVVLVASPGAGHLIPMAELARRLVADSGLAATLVTFTAAADRSVPGAPASVLSSLRAAGVAAAALPAVPLDDLPAGAGVAAVLLELIRRSVPHLRALLRGISSGSGAAPLTALVPDFFSSSMLPLAGEFGVPGYIFFPGNLAGNVVMRSAMESNEGASAAGEYRDLPDSVRLPGGASLRHADLPSAFRDCKAPVFASILDEGRRHRAVAGFLVNTFYEMEPDNVEELRRAAEQGAYPPVYPVGPLVRSDAAEEDDASACLEWLDRQPEGSVVYVSFGSAGALSLQQTAELAAGLEASGYRFLWVVRMPSLGTTGRSHHGDVDDDDPLAWLPEGFLERTSGRGLAVAAWAPQVRVLSHPATAAFVSHCGWNSTLEGVAAGVPMLAWPLYAEQRMNAAVLTEVTGVALRLGAAADGLIAREEIAAAVRELMDGEMGREVGRRAGDLRQAAARAWAADGSSRRAMEEVAGKWRAAALAKVSIAGSN